MKKTLIAHGTSLTFLEQNLDGDIFRESSSSIHSVSVHRIDGPAVICDNYDLKWYSNGILHRDEKEGPAIVRKRGIYITHEWWLNNNCIKHLTFVI